jgi:DNA polymerase-3 subunit beta
MPLALLQEQITKTEFAMAKESTKYAFNGALFKLDGRFECVGTDGRRLAVSSVAMPIKVDGVISVIVPAKAMNSVLKLSAKKRDAKDADVTVELRVTENRMTFVTDAVTIGTSLVEGTFPPYMEVIPKDAEGHATMSTAGLAGAMRRASLLLTDDMRGVRMHFSKKGLKISVSDPTTGEATVHLPCKFEGNDIEIGMNAKFVLDGLKVVPEDDVRLELSAPNRPGLFKAGDFQYVVMPIAPQ